MTALLQAELIKLRTTRTFAALTGFAIGTSLLVVVLVGILTTPNAETVVGDVFLADTSSLFILILAVIGISGEWRHRTIAGALLAAPDRLRFLGAKVLAFAAAGVVLSVLISIAVTVVGMTIVTARDLPVPDAGELMAQYGRNALVAALLGAFGVTIGGLVRNQIAAIVGLLILLFLVEPLLTALVPEVGRFSPVGSLPTAVQGLAGTEDFDPDGELLAVGPAVLAMLAWISVTFAATGALLRRRDLQ